MSAITTDVLFDIIGEKEIFNIPKKFMQMLADDKQRRRLIAELEKYEHSRSDSFQYFFESEVADRKTFKQDYTPQAIGEIAANIVGKGDYLEMAAGTGSLAINAQHYDQSRLYLTEFSEIALPFLIANMLVRGYDAVISHEDSLTGEVFGTYHVYDKNLEVIEHSDGFNAQRIIMNPPYSMKWTPTADTIFMEYGTPPKSKADFAFVLKAFERLDENGTMAVVLPHGVLFRGNQEADIRTNLVERGHLAGVIGLPAKLFANTSIPTVILVLTKQPVDQVMFVDASSEFTVNGKQNVLEPEHIEKIVDTFKNKKTIDRYSRLIELDEIKSNDFNLNIPRYIDTFEPEPVVDIYQIRDEIEQTSIEIQELNSALNKQFKELNLPDDFRFI